MELDAGSTAWMLTSASLVLLMTPGLAFFYGGMTRSKSVLNMMMMSFGAIGVVGVVYVLFGYSMSFATDALGTKVVDGEEVGKAGIIGNPFTYFGLKGLLPTSADGADPNGLANTLYPGVPALVVVAFQVTFAIITVALISGAIADRSKFSTWLVFSGLWVSLCYFPLAHMVWGGGFLSANGPFGSMFTDIGPLDFAGGTVVHINAGMAGLVLALIIGKRIGWRSEPMRPHNLTLVMLGAGLLWFGWFGFNAGSAAAANGTAGLAWMNTTAATCAAMIGWLVVEKIRDKHATSLGAASGVVAGLVAITPAAGSVSPVGSLFLGAIAGALCALAVGLKYKFNFDDSLDVVGVHLVGGFVGTVLIGLFSTSTGLFYGEGVGQLVVQVLVALSAVVFSGVITLIIGLALKHTMGWRIDRDAEVEGIDINVHGEAAYDLIGGGGRQVPHAASPTAPSAAPARVSEEVTA
jgi:ammonium transporter, Amt family